jgi:hypothetical protein
MSSLENRVKNLELMIHALLDQLKNNQEYIKRLIEAQELIVDILKDEENGN